MSRLTTNPRADSRFLVRKKLGAGSMGIVYEAVDRERDEVVALKTLINSDAADLYRFKQEFRTLADIHHPNLVNLYELFAEDERCFFTMERIRGVNFLEYVRPRHAAIEAAATLAGVTSEDTAGGLELAQAAERSETAPDGDPSAPKIGRLRIALRGLAEGVAFLHASGKVHRDLKPSNVMVEDSGRVVILDFGLAADLSQARDLEGGGLHGTAAYMAPEQAETNAATAASDWYAVGVMLYEALTGQRPHTGTVLHILMDKRTVDPRPPQELVVGLPEDLCALCMDLLAREPGKRPDGPTILRRVGASADTRELVAHSPAATRLVGRERELAQLDAALARVEPTSPVSVFIHGVSGVGKSALVQHFLRGVEERAAAEHPGDPEAAPVILRGRCHVRESVPYKALDGVIDGLSRFLIERAGDDARVYLPREMHALSRLFPVMRTALEALGAQVPIAQGLGARPTPDQVELRRRAFAALRELLGRLAARRRVILWIDDLQWADADSALLLDELLRMPAPPGVLLVASLRRAESEDSPLVRGVLNRLTQREHESIELAPLTLKQTRELAVELLGGPALAHARAHHLDAIIQEAAGSPFLVEQLARHVLSGDVVSGPGLSLVEMLESQIARLPEGARPLLDTLAVAARPVQHEIAFHAAKIERKDSHALVKRLRAANLVRLSAGSEDLELYHDRIREALVADIATSRGASALSKIHRRLARALVKSRSRDYERLYVHHREAGDTVLAASYAAQAAKRATDALAFDQAANFYRAALDLAPIKDSEVLDHRTLERGLGDALANAGRCREAAHAYLRTAVLVLPTPALELRRMAAQQLLISGHIDEGQAVLAEVLSEVGLRLANSPRRALLGLMAHRLRLRLRGTHFVERPLAKIPPDLLFKIDVCWAVSTGLGMIDSVRAAEFQTRGLLMALDAGDPLRISLAESMEAAFVGSSGVRTRAQAAELARDALALANRVDDPQAVALATMTVGACAYMVGEWRRAAARCHEADVMLGRMCTGVPWQTATTRRFWMSALLRLGEYGELARGLPEFLRDANERGNLYASTDFRGRLNLLWLVRDDPEGARADIEDVMARWTTGGWYVQHWNALHARVQADLYCGSPQVALDRLDRDWGNISRSLVLRVEVIKIDAFESRARAQLALAASEPVTDDPASHRRRDRALRAIERDIATLESMRVAWAEPHVALLRAGLAALRGERGEALAGLRSAIGGYELVEMQGLANAARRQLGLLLGDDTGRTLVAQADAWMRAQGVRDPARFAAMYAAGFAPPQSRARP
ncbi:MAG: protein kinase [Myxococcales bacterium]|nr:protein kinase [Myxococcales bacterium]